MPLFKVSNTLIDLATCNESAMSTVCVILTTKRIQLEEGIMKVELPLHHVAYVRPFSCHEPAFRCFVHAKFVRLGC